MDCKSTEDIIHTNELSSNDFSEEYLVKEEYLDESEIIQYSSEVERSKPICKECSLFFPNEFFLDMHIQAIHYKFQCPQCPKQFKTKSAYEKHANVHVQKLFECDICHKLFGKRYLLKKHLSEICRVEEMFICEFCTYIGKDRNALYNHHVNVHMSPFKTLRFIKCPKCLLSLRGKEAYDEHQLYHDRQEKAAEKSND